MTLHVGVPWSMVWRDNARIFKASIDVEHELQGSCCVTALESSWVMVNEMWLMVWVCQGHFYTLLQAVTEFQWNRSGENIQGYRYWSMRRGLSTATQVQNWHLECLENVTSCKILETSGVIDSDWWRERGLWSTIIQVLDWWLKWPTWIPMYQYLGTSDDQHDDILAIKIYCLIH